MSARLGIQHCPRLNRRLQILIGQRIVVTLAALSGTIKVVEYRFYLAIVYSDENGHEISK